MKRTLINVEDHEIRIAILEDNVLSELFIENFEERTIVGNVYKGRIEDVKPGIQAAFVNIGQSGKNAFLHFDDVKYEACQKIIPRKLQIDEKGRQSSRKSKKRLPPPRFPNPADYLKPGQELIVQASKDPIGTKGCRITTNISLAGRYLVLLPFAHQNSGGISRKIEDQQERRRLRTILNNIKENDASFIVRTAGLKADQDAIKGDVEYLKKLWASIKRKSTRTKELGLLQDDRDILFRVVRDILQPDMDEIWIDSRSEYTKLRRYLKSMVPNLYGKTHHYKGLIGLFDKYDVERQILRALRRKVWLRHGGTLIFDEMEAMTAIDVNTGKFTGKSDQKETTLKTNLEAARMIARQLRLRDIGGLIVIDFIDMESEQDRRKLMREFSSYMKNDRARHTILKVSDFGLVEMTRKRVRGSLQKLFYEECPICQGSGMVFTFQQIWRALKRSMVGHLENAPRPCLTIRLHPKLKRYVTEHHLDEIQKWINRFRIDIQLLAWEGFHVTEFEVEMRPKVGRRNKFKTSVGKIERYSAINLYSDLSMAQAIQETEERKKAEPEERKKVEPEETKAMLDLPAAAAPALAQAAPALAQGSAEKEPATADDTSSQPPKKRRRGRRGGRRRRAARLAREEAERRKAEERKEASSAENTTKAVLEQPSVESAENRSAGEPRKTHKRTPHKRGHTPRRTPRPAGQPEDAKTSAPAANEQREKPSSSPMSGRKQSVRRKSARGGTAASSKRTTSSRRSTAKSKRSSASRTNSSQDSKQEKSKAARRGRTGKRPAEKSASRAKTKSGKNP